LGSSLFSDADADVRRLLRPDGAPEPTGSAPVLPEAPPVPLDPPKTNPEPAPQAAEVAARAEPAPTTCPRCQGKLVDTAGLGWCPGCGYCHSLEQDRAKVPVPAPVLKRKKKKPGAAEFAALIIHLPFWVWVMAAGVLTIGIVTGLMSHSARLAPFPRCIWCSLQIAGGLIVLLLASFLALLQVASEDETMTAKDVFLPIRLWSLTCKRLPRTSMAVCLAVWGITAIASAAVLVGGLGEWFKHLPKASTAANPTTAVSRYS
jgi:hypothetical protein